MWDLSGSGIEPPSPELAGRFLTTEPPGKPRLQVSSINFEVQEERLTRHSDRQTAAGERLRMKI